MSILSKAFGEIPIIGDIFGGVEDVVGAVVKIGELLLGFFSEIDEVFRIIVNLFKLGKEAIMWVVVNVKNFIEIILESLELIQYITDLLLYIMELVKRYIHIPMIFLILIPFLYFASYYIDFVEAIVDFI